MWTNVDFGGRVHPVQAFDARLLDEGRVCITGRQWPAEEVAGSVPAEGFSSPGALARALVLASAPEVEAVFVRWADPTGQQRGTWETRRSALAHDAAMTAK